MRHSFVLAWLNWQTRDRSVSSFHHFFVRIRTNVTTLARQTAIGVETLKSLKARNIFLNLNLVTSSLPERNRRWWFGYTGCQKFFRNRLVSAPPGRVTGNPFSHFCGNTAGFFAELFSTYYPVEGLRGFVGRGFVGMRVMDSKRSKGSPFSATRGK